LELNVERPLAVVKKDRKTPKTDLDLAKKRMKQYLHGHE
jgi:phage-related protein